MKFACQSNYDPPSSLGLCQGMKPKPKTIKPEPFHHWRLTPKPYITRYCSFRVLFYYPNFPLISILSTSGFHLTFHFIIHVCPCDSPLLGVSIFFSSTQLISTFYIVVVSRIPIYPYIFHITPGSPTLNPKPIIPIIPVASIVFSSIPILPPETLNLNPHP